MTVDKRKNPKPQYGFGIYNQGILIGYTYRKKDAIAEVERMTGVLWESAKRSMEVHKVIVSKVMP